MVPPDLDSDNALSVAIVGTGPRGLSVLERLLIRLSPGWAPRDVVIWAIDPVEHGPGRVWRTDQPGWLTMNATAGEVTVRSPDNDLLAGSTVTDAPSFADWTVEADGQRLGSDDYPERRQYGRYLRAIFDQLSAHAPAGVRVHRVRGVVTALHRGGGRQWLEVDHGTRRLRVDKVVLATGHADLEASDEDLKLRNHVDRHPGLRYIGQGLVTDLPLRAIAPGDPLAVRGLGLAFYDVLWSLTLGRGGRFRPSGNGALQYLPSGQEPVIYAGSRSGLPFLARARVTQPPQTSPNPVVLTPERLRALRATALATRGSPQLDFAAEVKPLLQHEMGIAYYGCAARLRSGQGAERRLTAAYRALLDDDHPVEQARVGQLLVRHGLGDLRRVRFEALARPFDQTAFSDAADFSSRLLGLLRRDVAESRRGTVVSPLKAALETLRTLRPALPSVVDFGGLLPASHRDFLTRWAPMSLVLSAGPPASHVEQVTALIEAGVLEIVGPQAQFSAGRADRGFTVESPAVPGSRRTARVMLDARVPTTDLRRDTAPLVRQLLAIGRIGEYVNTGPGDQERFATGGLAVTPTPSHVVDAEGRPDPDLYAIGVATEHTRWFTQVGTGRPGRDSPFCHDADGIALDVLAVLRA